MTAPTEPTPEPTPGPTRRERRTGSAGSARGRGRIWAIVIGVVVLVAAAAVIAYLVGREHGKDSVTTTTTSSSSTTTSSSTSTTASTTTTSSTLVPPPPSGDPQAYAETLFQAWANNDRTAAASVANQAAIDALFATPSTEAAAYTFSSCEPGAGNLYCSWTRPGGQLLITVNDGTGGTPVQVVEVTIGPG
jgi:hypothetical protein